KLESTLEPAGFSHAEFQEIWFYYYGEDDPRTDYYKEFTYYCKTDKEIKTTEEMINHLKKVAPITERYNVDTINCIKEEHYQHLSKWFEITAEEFTDGCGISA
ncbi:MAG: hypothetical protein GX285_01895, partial [Clostridiales bacterium]|nr:hypothetical protein [Clostridiales bacterium]